MSFFFDWFDDPHFEIFPAILSPEDPRTVWKLGTSLSRIFFSATCDLFSLTSLSSSGLHEGLGWNSLVHSHVSCHGGIHPNGCEDGLNQDWLPLKVGSGKKSGGKAVGLIFFDENHWDFPIFFLKKSVNMLYEKIYQIAP